MSEPMTAEENRLLKELKVERGIYQMQAESYTARALGKIIKEFEEKVPEPSANVVRIKPLEWNGGAGRGVLTSYRVSYNASGQPWGYTECGAGYYAERDQGFGVFVSGPHETRKDAEQSADSHYERLIRTALSSTEGTEG